MSKSRKCSINSHISNILNFGYTIFFLLLFTQILNANILYVDDDHNYSYSSKDIQLLNKYYPAYTSWTVYDKGLPSSTTLCSYDIVMWETGEYGLESVREGLLQSYLDGGGKLFILGKAVPSNSSFCKNYLHAESYSTIYDYRYLISNDNHGISKDLGFDVYIYKYIHISTSAVPLFWINSSTNDVVGLCYSTDTYKLVFFCFSFYSMQALDSKKEDLFYRVFSWLGQESPTFINISGYVQDTNGSPFLDVKIKLIGNSFSETTTDPNGFYQFSNIINGLSTIIPEKEGYKFTPYSRAVSCNSSNQNFVGEVVEQVEFKVINNLFNPKRNQSVKITYDIPITSEGSLKIYTTNGELIRTLLDGRISAGGYEFYWDGTSNNNESVASGLYILHLQGPSLNEIKKIILVK